MSEGRSVIARLVERTSPRGKARQNPSCGTAGTASRRVLLIAFHYPPCQESSGYLRTLSFSRLLPKFGWQPLVLTAHPRAYPQVRDDQCRGIPESLPLVRAFALDARRHLSIRNRYPSFASLPDRWSSWWFGAVPAGLAMIRRYRPSVIWATQPIVTAHCVAGTLHRLTGLPWVADFRDPVSLEEGCGRATARVRGWVERQVISSCARAVFTAPGTARDYAERYPAVPPEHWAVIPNGYNESDFAMFDATSQPPQQRQLRLVHSGVLYPDTRDPQPLFEAVARLVSDGRLSSSELEIVLRASGHEERYRGLARRLGIGTIIRLEPAIPYAQALREMGAADGLLVIQGRQYDGQIPTKVFEYLRVRRPILALAGEAGDTAQVLREAGIDTIAPPDDKERIAAALLDFMSKVRSGAAPLADDDTVAKYERGAACRQLARLFDEITAVELAPAMREQAK